VRPTFTIAFALTAIVTVLGTLAACDSLPRGLAATYYADPDWSTSPAVRLIDPAPSRQSLFEAWNGQPPDAFSVTWTGSFIAMRPGTYRFETESDDGSWVYVDERLVVDNGGGHSATRSAGAVPLERGVHSIFIKYFQRGGPFDFEVSWAQNADQAEPLPSWALFPRRASYTRLLASVVLRRALTAATWAWFAVLLFACGEAIVRALAGAIRRAGGADLRGALTAIVVLSLLLDVTALWWGLPGPASTWVGDELTPSAVLLALSRRFSGGWFARYPPFHFYVLSAVCGPWILAWQSHWIDVSRTAYFTTIVVLTRLVSVVMAAGTIVVVGLCGERLFGRRAGVFAAATLALAAPFVFYAKAANPEIPYLFWFALSLLFLLRALDSLALPDFIGLAVTATLAVCTKDQAYGLYLAVPPILVHRLWRHARASGGHARFLRALVDVRLVWALSVSIVTFAAIYLLPFNWSGFTAHVADITGPGSQPYQMVPASTLGRLSLLGMTVALDCRTWGWPLTIASAFGFVVALVDAKHRRAATIILLVAVGYYVGFINVVRYEYDRYLLPIALLQSLAAGFAVDWLLESVAWRAAGVIVATAFAYTTLYSATVDALMLHDSRHAATNWLRARAGGRTIGRAFPLVVLPDLDGLQSMDIGTVAGLRLEKPDYFVLNADYARAVDVGSPLGALVRGLEGQTLGYRLVFRYRAPAPWPWLPGGHPDLVGPRLDPMPGSFLRAINPTIEIYERTHGAG
jgi:fibro-slime domain-containing protein